MTWTKKKTNEMIKILEADYPEAECALQFGSIFQLLIAVTLSAQTTDKQVNVVSEKLFERYPNSYAMSQADEQELQSIIKRIGMYKTKAKNISNISKIIDEKYSGVVPDEFEELIKLPGVGRKTANVVLSVGFGIPAIAVDTHVFRVSNRIGIVSEPDVLKTEYALMKAIPKDKWTKMHHSLIWHGRNVCIARKPRCIECSLRNLCEYRKRED